jgi:subtilisin family serine protease
LEPAYGIADWVERGRFVYRQLQAAERGSQELYSWLENAHAKPHQLLTAHAIAADVDVGLLEALAARAEIGRIGPNALAMPLESQGVAAGSPRPPAGAPGGGSVDAVEWNIAKIRADQAWAAFGVRGQGTVVGDIGTGVMYEHAALVQQYRGNLGDGTFDHNYNWFDLVSGQAAPYDDSGHSTFGVGVAVGSDGGANQIGVAPAARWIAVKVFDAYGGGTLEDLHAAMEWMLAPTDLSGANPDPAKRPNVGLNMWGLWGGCDTEFNPDVQAWQAAGILPVFAIGGEGPGCSLIRSPADMVGAFAAGATDGDDNISGFSARGPGCYGAIKPEVSAPGVNIRSSTNDGGYQVWSGTSFSAAHLAGAAALVLSADPSLGLDELETIVKDTAVCRDDLMCGGSPCPDGMNNTYGWGRIDAYEAVAAALSELPPLHVAGIKLSFRDQGMGR